MNVTRIAPILILALVVILAGGALNAAEQDIATSVQSQNSSQSATPMTPPTCEGDVADLSVSKVLPSENAPVKASGYSECIQSYIQCTNDCQSYSEPTRTQCENWCFQTHWCTQV